MRPPKGARFPVLLDCGHDVLVSSATYFAGWAPCRPCVNPPRPPDVACSASFRMRSIARAYLLRNLHCVRTRLLAARSA